MTTILTRFVGRRTNSQSASSRTTTIQTTKELVPSGITIMPNTTLQAMCTRARLESTWSMTQLRKRLSACLAENTTFLWLYPTRPIRTMVNY